MPAHKYQTTKGIMWYASINYIDPVTKKSARKVKRGFATKREAKDYETDFLAQIKKEGFDSSINPKAPFLEVYKAYQRHVECLELRPDTIETKSNMIDHYILPYFEKYTIGQVDEVVLTEFYDVKPDFNAVRQPYKNLKDKRIQKRITEGKTGAKLYDWWNVNQVKNISKEKTAHPC